ncbi:MAG: glycosyltransferase family 39 protein [Chloroflexia bacterium]
MKPWLPEDPTEATLPVMVATTATTNTRSSRFLDLWLLALILGVTVFIRLWELGSVPVDVMPDEVDYLNVIYRTILGTGPKFFEFTFDWSQTALNNYIQTAFVQLFGLTNTVVGIRMSAVVMSIPAVIPFYFLLRGSFGRWTALFTTLLFASSWWYLNLSRTAWVNTFVVSNGLMALWLIELALRAESRRRALLLYSLAGLFTSLCLYGYAAGKVLVLSICLYVGLQWLFALWGRRRAARADDPHILHVREEVDDPTAPGELVRPMWHQAPPRPALTFVGAILFALVAIAVFLPQVHAILKYWNNYMDRPQAVSITNVQLPYEGLITMEEVYRQQVRKVFDGWILMCGLENVPPSVLVRYNPPGESFVDPVTRILFMAGMLLSLLMLRQSLFWWILWLLGLAITQVLTTDIPNAARAVIVIPSVYYFVACSIYWILRFLGYISGRQSKGESFPTRSSPPCLPSQTAYTSSVVTKSPSIKPSRIGLALAALICAGLVVYNVRHYWDWVHLPITADARQPSVELAEFEEWQYLQWALAKTNQRAFSVDHWHVLRSQQPVGLVVAYYRSPDWIGPPEWLRRGSPAALVADSPVVGPEPYSVRWKGFLRVPADGEYKFTCITDGVCKLIIDGRTMFNLGLGVRPEGVTVSIPLTTGPHSIEIFYAHRNAEVQSTFRLQWQAPGQLPGDIPTGLLTPSKYTLNP